jgi:CHAD domain-containing protein
MAFRYKLGETFEEGFRRIALEQIDRAQAQLREEGEEVAVHETRKSLKRLRALLRLLRPAIGEHAFRHENAQLRDIGLSLSGARDRHVLLETTEKLDAAAPFARREIAGALQQAITASNGAGAPLTMKGVSARLAEAKQRLEGLAIEGSGFDVVGAGLERSYHKARRAFREAYEEPSDEAFHEWRKGAQAHWRQMTLLSRAWPAYLEARAEEARELSQLLGDDHDLALLVTFVHSDAAEGLTGEQAAVIETAARRRQAVFRTAAKPRGERLFAENPKRLRRSIGIYWGAACALKGQEEAEKPEEPPAPPKGRRTNATPRRRPSAGAKA